MPAFLEFLRFIIVLLLGGCGVCILIFPEFRTLVFNGVKNVFLQDVSKTPEGAKTIFETAIEENRKKYTEASDLNAKLAGQLKLVTRKKEEAEESVQNYEEQATELYNAGRTEDARLMAERRTEALEDLRIQTAQVERLTPMVKQSTDIMNHYESEIRRLQRESKQKVSQLEYARMMESVTKGLDSLRQDNSAGKLLEMVDQSVNEVTATAEGRRQAYDAKVSSRVASLEQEKGKRETDAFMARLASGKKS